MTDNEEEERKLPEMLVLEGEDARRFEEYDKRPLSEKEQQSLKEADRVYKYMCDKNKKIEQAEKFEQNKR